MLFNYQIKMQTLSIRWTFDPEIFSIGPLHVRYYGLCFVMAFVVSYIIFQKIFKREKLPIPLLDKLSFNVFFSVLIGARLGHCFFYEPAYYLANPIKIFAVWEGGLASHGAAIGILIGLWWFCYKNKKQFLWIMDRIAIVVSISGCFVRFGNLMNSEIYGHPTTLPWGFEFVRSLQWHMPPINEQPCHPTQIYEALSYLLLFFLLWYLYRKHLQKLNRGTLFGIFLILLFTARFLIEYVKETQVEFEQGMALNMGQLLSIPFIIAGIVLLLWSIMYGKPDDSLDSVKSTPPKVVTKPKNKK